MNYEDWLLDWFTKNGNCGDTDLRGALGSNFFELGFIDSFQFINLLGDIEAELGVTFDNEQFQDRDFSTIRGLAACISRRLGKGN